MADAYSMVKAGKLKLKGEKKHKSKKNKKHKRKREHSDSEDESSPDLSKHGGWWSADQFSEVTGQVAVEVGDMCYLQSQDDGKLVKGPSRNIGEGPDPTEIMMAVRVGDSKVAFKSGYDKYLSVEGDGLVYGRSDAIGVREQFQPVFQDGKLALLSYNNHFLTIDEDSVVFSSKTAGENQFIHIRSCAERLKKLKTEDVDTKSSKEVELHYVKRFQSFQDRRLRINDGAKRDIRDAKKTGNLHETLLDRRSKMKADRYCK